MCISFHILPFNINKLAWFLDNLLSLVVKWEEIQTCINLCTVFNFISLDRYCCIGFYETKEVLFQGRAYVHWKWILFLRKCDEEILSVIGYSCRKNTMLFASCLYFSYWLTTRWWQLLSLGPFLYQSVFLEMFKKQDK